MLSDYCVVGGGIVGMATAMSLLRQRPGASVVVLEKEVGAARHQSGHNSGVIHSGIYYKPGSLKARLCLRGAQMTKQFCAEHGIPVIECGKIIVATNGLEHERLQHLAKRAVANRVVTERLSRGELRSFEPNIDGMSALLVPSTGVVDYGRVTDAMASVVRASGGEIVYGADVTSILESARSVDVRSGERTWSARYLVACAGLQADRVARTSGLRPAFHTVPFRGEYYRLAEGRGPFVRRLVYPVPDPALPFLGVHLTLTTSGGITIGPNAVLALSREGYSRGSVRTADVLDYLGFPGFWRFARGYAVVGALELRNSVWKRGFLRECRKYAPSLRADDLLRHRAGIRAQAVLRNGALVHDFLFEETRRMLHVCNAPSPAATSAMAIGETIVSHLLTGQGDRQ